MRIFLYILSVLLFAVYKILLETSPATGEKFFYLWAVSFLWISGDVINQLKISRYLFFPAGYILITLHRFLELPYEEYANLAGGILHLFLGGMLLHRFFITEKSDKEIRFFLLTVGLFSLLFGSQVILFFYPLNYLEIFYRFRISSYFLVAISGRFLLLNRFVPRFPGENKVTLLLVMIHIYILTEKVLENFFL